MKQVYAKTFQQTPQEQPKQVQLQLPKLEIPTEQSSFTLIK